MTTGSPQSWAIEHMMATDEQSLMDYVNDGLVSDAERTTLMEWYALLVFYYASNGPTTWTERDTIGFTGSTKDVCRWQEGTTATMTNQNPMGVQCDDTNTVSSLSIRE